MNNNYNPNFDKITDEDFINHVRDYQSDLNFDLLSCVFSDNETKIKKLCKVGLLHVEYENYLLNYIADNLFGGDKNEKNI